MLIPMSATHYHGVAPDFPGFGQSAAPSPAEYTYTFDHLAETVGALLEQLKVSRYTLYLFDYGAPVGYLIILAHPKRLQALIVQNGNAYQEGLGPKWAKIAHFAACTIASNASVCQALLIPRDVERAVDRDAVDPVFDRQLAERHGCRVVGEGCQIRHRVFIQSNRLSSSPEVSTG